MSDQVAIEGAWKYRWEKYGDGEVEKYLLNTDFIT